MAGRARLRLAAADGLNNVQMAHHLGVAVDTVRLWRQRWPGWQAVTREALSVDARFTAAPRPGRPAQITAAPHCQMSARACEAPRTTGRPISQWTRREIAAAILPPGMVPLQSPTSVRSSAPLPPWRRQTSRW